MTEDPVTPPPDVDLPPPSWHDETVQMAVVNEQQAWQQRKSEIDQHWRDSEPTGPVNPMIKYEDSQIPLVAKAASTAGNFNVILNPDLTYTVSYGTVRGNVPTLGGPALGTVPAPTGSLAGTGVEKVYFQVSVTLTKTIDGTYVRSWELDSVIIKDAGVGAIEDVPEADDLTSGVYNFELATFVDGVKIGPQPVRTSLSFLIEDDQSGTGGGQIYFF